MKTFIIILAVVIVGMLGVMLFQSSRMESNHEVPVTNLETTSSTSTTAQTQTKNASGYYSVESAQFEQLAQESGVTVVNVHVPYAGEIAGTDAFIPYNKIASSASALPQDKSAKIAVYCRSGGMSAVASKELVRLGYTNVYDLSGGMNAYQASGRTLEQKPQQQ